MLVQSTDFAAWIKAALLRSAAPGPARTGLRPWGADPAQRAGPSLVAVREVPHQGADGILVQLGVRFGDRGLDDRHRRVEIGVNLPVNWPVHGFIRELP